MGATGVAERAARAAVRRLQRGQRLDLADVAAEVGVSRATLHRHTGGRTRLAGEALWLMTELALDTARRTCGWRPSSGTSRSTAIAARYLKLVSGDAGLRRLLDDEPEFAMRVLTAPDGCVEPRLIHAVTALLDEDVHDGLLEPVLPTVDIAYAVVKLGESFLYADIVSSRAPDVDAATRIITAVIEARPPAAPRRPADDRSGVLVLA